MSKVGVTAPWLCWLVLLMYTSLCQCQSPCASRQTCHDCIQSATCVWCSQSQFPRGTQRCFDSSQTPSYCNDTDDPDNELEVVQNRSLSSRYDSAEGEQDAVQITPQKVEARLRINRPQTLVVKYAEAEDYPVDLYYLMDLSYTMKNHKDTISSLGNSLAENMKNITKNFRLGFGSFIDRVVLPFTNTNPNGIKNPCGKNQCVPSYGFKNHMKLTTDTALFNKKVRNADLSGNYDTPEGVLDAIMQAVVCKAEIGWRDHARRLLVLSTDSDFHIAGDGKLGGLVLPNDGLCHLENDVYNSKDQDYPSVSQINSKVKDNYNIIFAVTEKVKKAYEQLAAHLDGSACSALSRDSANVVDLIRAQYDKIRSSVELKDNAPSWVKVTYYSQCLNESSPLVQRSKCEGIKLNERSAVEFYVQVEVTSCPKNPQEWNHTFHIHPMGIQEASLEFNLHAICSCSCEHPGNKGYVENALSCSGNGTDMCGVCECHAGYRGQSCNCTGSSTESVSSDSCRQPNTTGPDCSGLGTCVCGKCDCHPRPNPQEKYSGAFCECDNFSCPRGANSMVCSGSAHGACVCGRCECLSGWTGDACECATGDEKCREPGSEEVCSGHGYCRCGTLCVCQEHYHGLYCEKCPTCPSRCEDLMTCIICAAAAANPGTADIAPSNKPCPHNCSVTLVADIQVGKVAEETLCTEHDARGCRYMFSYSYDENRNIAVRAKRHPECPKPVHVPMVVGSMVGSIVFIGVVTLLVWKLFTTIHDRREFIKFEKERASSKWSAGANPLYRKATSSFRNPMYRKQIDAVDKEELIDNQQE